MIMSIQQRHSWPKRIAAGFVGALGLTALCLPLAPAKAQVSFGFSTPGVSVGVGAPYGYYYSPPYYGYPYYYGYPAYGGVYLNFGGHHGHWHHHR
jgi:hypothetical protein